MAPLTCGIKRNGSDKSGLPLVGKTGCEPDVTHTKFPSKLTRKLVDRTQSSLSPIGLGTEVDTFNGTEHMKKVGLLPSIDSLKNVRYLVLDTAKCLNCKLYRYGSNNLGFYVI